MGRICSHLSTISLESCDAPFSIIEVLSLAKIDSITLIPETGNTVIIYDKLSILSNRHSMRYVKYSFYNRTITVIAKLFYNRHKLSGCL